MRANLEIDHQLLDGREGGELGSGAHAGPRNRGEGPPPQPHEAVLPADGCNGVYHALGNR